MKFLNSIYHNLSVTPFLLFASFMLARYSHNRGDLLLTAIAWPLLAAALICLVLQLIFALLIKNKTKRFFSISVLILFNFSFGEVIYFLNKIGLAAIANTYAFFPLWLGLMNLSFVLIYKTKRNLASVNRFIFIFSIFAVLLPLLTIVPYEITRTFIHPKIKSPMLLPEISKAGPEHGLPDIYYILPDSYTSSALLKDSLNYDNSEFVKYLEAKGFYIAQDSTSNYPVTFLSLASTLNMEYLDYLSVYKSSLDKTVVIPLINDSNVKKFLAKFGYKYYQLGSWWGLTNNNPLADRNFISEEAAFGETNFFNYSILYTTLASPVVERIFSKISLMNMRADVRKLSLYQLDELPEIAKINGPKFVFAHILAPHDPYVLGRHCELVTAYDKKVEELYADQTNCVNEKLRVTIDRIIENSKTPPVILIQSDEGVPDFNKEKSSEDAWEEADDAMLQEKFPVFAAYYLPGVSTSSLYSSISNVNSFREILNLYFSTDLPILPDKNYIFPNERSFYELIDVTDRVKKD